MNNFIITVICSFGFTAVVLRTVTKVFLWSELGYLRLLKADFDYLQKKDFFYATLISKPQLCVLQNVEFYENIPKLRAIE